jgi:hypothetical protein
MRKIKEVLRLKFEARFSHEHCDIRSPCRATDQRHLRQRPVEMKHPAEAGPVVTSDALVTTPRPVVEARVRS